MSNFQQHLAEHPFDAAILIILIIGIIGLLIYIIYETVNYGGFSLLDDSVKVVSGIVAVFTIIFCIHISQPIPEDNTNTGEIAIVLGNTANTPVPKIEGIKDKIEEAMLLHKGEDVAQWSEAIIFISADGKPGLIEFNTTLEAISKNESNAKQNIENNIENMQSMLQKATPDDDGADYLDAIITAAGHVTQQTPIIVIGSGLSDSGALNFATQHLLVSESLRKESIEKASQKYNGKPLEGRTIYFYGLGYVDTSASQEALGADKRKIVRELYKDVIEKLGGTVASLGAEDDGADGKSNGSERIVLPAAVNEPEFSVDDAYFAHASAKLSGYDCSHIVDIYADWKDCIDSIEIVGYISKTGANDDPKLGEQRAETVKNALISAGIIEELIEAKGGGFGNTGDESQDRRVEIKFIVK